MPKTTETKRAARAYMAANPGVGYRAALAAVTDKQPRTAVATDTSPDREPVTVVIDLDGGVVNYVRVTGLNPDAVRVVVVDHDIDGIDDDQITTINEPGYGPSDVYLHKGVTVLGGIDLVFTHVVAGPTPGLIAP